MEKKVVIDKRNHALDILEQLNNFRKNNKHCDFIIKAGKEERPVHRYVISACSEYFDAMLTHDTKENRDGVVEIKDVDSECVMKCVDFMYTGEASVSDEKQGDLIHVAHMLRLHKLYNGVAVFLENKLDCQSFFSTREIANTYDCKNLTEVCYIFALKNFRELAQLEKFKTLEEEYLSFLLASEDLKVIESVKCKALMLWINHDSCRASSLLSLMKHIDFLNISLHYRGFLIDNEPALSTSVECMKLVMKSILDNEGIKPRDFPLDAKLGIMVFDSNNSKLKLVDMETEAWNEVQTTNNFENQTYSAVELDSYVYAFLTDCTTYRIKFGNDNAAWEEMANHAGGYGHAIAINGLIYMANHSDYSDQLEIYDPSLNKWSVTGNMPRKLYRSTLAVAEGKLFVIGGRDSSYGYWGEVKRYDPVTSSWSNVASLNHNRDLASAATLDSTIYVIGGNSGNGYVKSIEILHQNADSWELLDMPNLTRQIFNSIAFDGMIYLVGGNTSGSQTIDQFDPHAKKLTKILSLDFSITGYASVAASI